MVTRPGAGALLIRAWVDEGRLKARLAEPVDGETKALTVVGPEAVLAAVKGWVDQLAPPRGSERDGDRALCRYREYSRLMRCELDLDPSPPITALVADLMR